jgi:hypothetical protein
MAQGPIRRKTEKAIRDRAGVPVLLFYDEENDKTIMARGTADGSSYTILRVLDGGGEEIPLNGETQNNNSQLMINSDDVIGELQSIGMQLRIMNFHLSNITDMQVEKEDLE